MKKHMLTHKDLSTLKQLPHFDLLNLRQGRRQTSQSSFRWSYHFFGENGSPYPKSI